MFHSMQSAGEIQLRLSQTGNNSSRHIKPQGYCGEGSWRQVKGLFPDYLLGELPQLFEADYMIGNLHLAQTYCYLPQALVLPYP